MRILGTKVFPLALFLLASASLLGQSSVSLLDFEDASQFGKWRPLAGKISQNLDARYVSEGKASALFKTPSATTGEARWPRVELNLSNTAVGQDWSLYDELHFDLVNDMGIAGAFHLKITFADGTAASMYNHLVSVGKHQKVWTLPEAVREKKVLRLMLYQSEPPADFEIYLDNFRLVVNPALLSGRLATWRKNIELELPFQEWKKAGMGEQYMQLQQELVNIEYQDADPMQKSARLNALAKKFDALKGEVYARLCELAVAEFDQAFPGALWGYGWTHGARKVHREQLPYEGEIAGKANLCLARREVESVQIVLRAKQKVENVQLRVGELKNLSSGQVFPPEQIETMLVGYVKTLPTPYRVEPVTWRPDPLLSFMQTFDLDSDVWQPVWIDVTATADTPPGEYQGSITVTGKGVPELNVPFTVKVWDFELPLQATQPQLISFKSDGDMIPFIDEVYDTNNPDFQAFCRWKEGKSNELSAGAQRYRDLEIEMESLLLRHRVTPSPIYNNNRPLMVEDAQRWLAAGGNTLNITYLRPTSVKKDELFPGWVYTRVFNELDLVVPKLKEAGIFEYALLYALDEIGELTFHAAKDILQKVKQKYPELPILTTAYDPDYGKYTGLDQYFDAWCPAIDRFVREIDQVRYMQGQGKKVWFYTLTKRPGKVMGFVTEDPATAARMTVGLAQVMYKPDGFLYYSVLHGSLRQKRITTGPLTEHSGRSYSDMNGDGLLLYPSVAGAMSCIRLKAIRDGVEDFEYYHQLRKIDEMIKTEKLTLPPAEVQQLGEMLAINPQVMKDLEYYDRSGDILEMERRKIGDFLEKHKQ